MKRLASILTVPVLLLTLAGCSGGAKPGALPTSTVDEKSMFGVDKNITIDTIDGWLGRDDVAYIDVRMLVDPGDYAKIGGDPVLSGTVEGFEVVPYPFLANLTGLPQAVAATQYNGPTLFTLTWDDKGNIDTVKANFAESGMIIKDLFPEDKAIFLMCGGGGYAGFTRALLIKLGYKADKLYNIGGFWAYKGSNKQHVKVSYGENNKHEYNALHRLDYHLIQFDQLHKASE